MSTNNLIIGIGEALWDLLPDGRKIGGAPANFAYHASQCGYESLAVSAVGDDELGRELMLEFDRAGLHYHLAQTPYPTGTVTVCLDEQGVPHYQINTDVAWDHIPWTQELEAIARRTRAVCFGSLAQRGEASRGTILRFLDAVPQGAGSLRIFDINLRQHFYSLQVIEQSLQRSDILKINDEELVVVQALLQLQGDNEQELCRCLLECYDLDYVVLTCGAVCSHACSRTEYSYVPTPRVEVADTVGAGDSFTAAFVTGLLDGHGLAEAHHRATRVSAHVCTQHGAMTPLPSELIG